MGLDASYAQIEGLGRGPCLPPLAVNSLKMEVFSAFQITESGMDEEQILVPKEPIELIVCLLSISGNPEDRELKSKRFLLISRL